ncbi:hypothetical protein MUP38_00665 [Candidatus Bathyarchaeota archaeon]|nr:hypothetical protein [Candidatus Bathyarchaeota archaeon]
MSDAEFTVSGFRKHGHRLRSEWGKTHSYPLKRRSSPRLNSSENVNGANLILNAERGIVVIMPKKKFKGTPAMRVYWAEQKRKQREKKKKAKE